MASGEVFRQTGSVGAVFFFSIQLLFAYCEANSLAGAVPSVWLRRKSPHDPGRCIQCGYYCTIARLYPGYGAGIVDKFSRFAGICSKYYLLITWILKRYNIYIGFRQLSGRLQSLLGSCFSYMGWGEGHTLVGRGRPPCFDYRA